MRTAVTDRPRESHVRLRVVWGLLKHLHRHDLRAAQTFVRRMYPGPAGPLKWMRFLRWVCRQGWIDIPEGMRDTHFAKPLSDTPIWLAEGNPLGNYPWSRKPEARLPEQAEVVVIGAGFTGSSLAYHWAKSGAGKLLVVLEMGDPASGASGRNGGEVVMGRYFAMVFSTVRKYLPRLRPDLPPESHAQLARQFAAVYCRAAYKNADLVEKTIREESFDCGYAREGWVQQRSADEQAILDQTVRGGQENGFFDWDKLTADEASRKTGARIELPVNFSRGAGRFHPAKWVWSLLRRALQSDTVQLFGCTKVLRVEDEGEHYQVITERGAIEARHVVNATEAYTANLHPSFRNIISARQTQAAYGLDDGRSLRGYVSYSSSTFFVVRHEDGILFGSDETPIPDRDIGRNQPSRFITAYLAGQIQRSFGEFPLRITNEWAGSVGFTPDEYPVVGKIDGKRQYVIGGMSGSGTAVSFNAARCVCNRILGRTEPDDYPIEYFGPSRLLDPANHPWPEIDRPETAPSGLEQAETNA